MAAGWALVAEVDCAEPRVSLGSLAVVAGGNPDKTGWDASISTGYRDPTRRWVMPTPLPFTSAWRTTTTGNYARLAKADYTLTTAAAWIENPREVSGNIYLEGNGTNERVTTTADYTADAAWYVSVYIPSIKGLDDQTVLDFGMGDYGDSATISVRVRANGAFAVYKGTTQIGYSDLDFAASKQIAGVSSNQTTLSFAIIPLRYYVRDGATLDARGELLIISDGGTTMSVPFEGLGSGDNITPEGTIWWQVPNGRPSVQVAPCAFSETATIYGPIVKMRYAPDSPRGFSYTSWLADAAGGAGSVAVSLVDATTLSSYTPDGTTTDVRVKVEITGAGEGAFAVAAVDAYMPPEYDSTDDDPVDILEAMESLSLSVADWKEGGMATVKMTARLANLEAAGVVNPDTTIERPFRLALKDMDAGTPTDVDFFRGILRLDMQETAAGEAYPVGADVLTFVGYDRSREARASNYFDALAFDGLGLVEAIELALAEVGFDGTYTYGSTSSYTIPINDPVQGKWTELPDRGQNVGDWIEGLWERHGADWWRGWVPNTAVGYSYRMLAPSDLVDTPVIELFHSRADALAAGFTASIVPYRVVYGVTRYELAPEANQIIVIGQQTTGARKLLLSQSNDTAAQDPTTVVASRPAEWAGRVHRVLEINPGVTTQAQADSLKDTLAARLGVIRHVVEIDAPMLVIQANTRPLWTGDVVKLWYPGRATYELLRITAIPSLVCQYERTEAAVDAGERPIRRGTYRTERIGSG